MPRYIFVCPPCEEHEEKIVREVFMNIDYFDSEGKFQTCDKCGKLMKQEFGIPAVIYKGKGFYSTEYPKSISDDEKEQLERHLEDEYVDRTIKSGAYDAAKEQTETFVVDQYRDTKTNKKVNKPVVVPPIKD